MTIAPLYLRKNEDNRLRAGHLWVFSNEVDVKRSPLGEFQAGQLVVIHASDGRAIGTGYVNPHSLICARLVSRRADQVLDRSLLVHRINVALAGRQRVYGDAPYYRVIHGDSDGLPGLVVDRYGDVLVAQLNTAGMELQKGAVVEALQKVFHNSAILLRNDSSSRSLEGLESYVEVAAGDVPDLVELQENGTRFLAPVRHGQKTGWFYDHRENRARMRRYVSGARVLDVFSYVGGWGIQAATAGAREVTCVEASAQALDGVAANAELNGVTDRVTGLQGDAFDALRALRADKEQFDVVILDPPAFIKRKKDLKQGSAAYQRLNQMALQLLGKDGILVSASCSYHLQRDKLLDMLYRGGRHLDRSLQVLEQGHQGPDHPIHPAIPETDYLKCYIARAVLA